MAEITPEQLKQAEASHADLKRDKKVSPEDRQTSAEALTQLRQAYRIQEEAAGRRTGLVKVEE